MNASAPNLPWLGFQLSLRMYDKPDFANAGHAFCVVATAIAPRMNRIVRPAPSATIRNVESAAAPRPLAVRALSGCCWSVAAATGSRFLGGDLAQLGDRLRREVRR